ncbi:hypothetical protein GOB17_30515 [Sinorhizobium meliloti]|uniref:hypothetical protein n=1 Tax=Rhizobium meliloti TaxID=382 RepID=UPI000FD84CD8|nr:hypothetical protein [Sinorhizobium meliloti]MDW9583910.1 hypothetical protein [Sinorhizobium meliloti]MDX0184586.1 hypothetical protein [Sinorhizobium meliloti]MDX2329946.1 hypothetical protein [Sinorhizobium medicae]RVL25491.1 hypothetical protein CN144_26390 [Sinorhizobium meliloti]
MLAAKNACEIDQTDQEIDEVAAALAWHDGDPEATIRTLLADCKHLREQLALAEIAMSLGFTRGWRPACIGGSEAEQP